MIPGKRYHIKEFPDWFGVEREMYVECLYVREDLTDEAYHCKLPSGEVCTIVINYWEIREATELEWELA